MENDWYPKNWPPDEQSSEIKNLNEILKKYLQINDIDSALEICLKEIEVDSNYAPAWNEAAVCYYYLHNWEKALECSAIAVKIDPEYAFAWYNRAEILNSAGELDEALECYKKSVQINDLPNNGSFAWCALADCLQKLNRDEEALEAINKSINIKSDYSLSWNNKGYILCKLHRHEEARNCFKNALNCYPQALQATVNLRYCEFYHK